jgi:hypothetical protein
VGFSSPSPFLKEKELTTTSRLVDEMIYEKSAEAVDSATSSAILGPFFRHNAPLLPNESSILHGVDDGEITYMHGEVLDQKTKNRYQMLQLMSGKLLRMGCMNSKTRIRRTII